MNGIAVLLVMAAMQVHDGQPATSSWDVMSPGQITREWAQTQYPDAFDTVVVFEGETQMTLGELYDRAGSQNLTFKHYAAVDGGNQLYVVRYDRENMQRVIVVEEDDFGLSVVADTQPDDFVLLDREPAVAMDCEFAANEIRCVAIVGNRLCLIVFRRNGGIWLPPETRCTDL